MTDQTTPATPIPAATILILRDAPDGMEVFMVKRHHQIDFVAGALVFPGGKVSPRDAEAAGPDRARGVDALSPPMRSIVAAGIREAFEECGILFACAEGEEALIAADQVLKLQAWRQRLESGEVGLRDLLDAENLQLAGDRLVHFAHWVTPENMPKRFDTHFFLAEAPAGHIGAHDGRESVDSLWIRPADAIADRKRWNVIFPTKLNLMKLAEAQSVAEAMARAAAAPPLTVIPWVEQTDQGPCLRIRDDAGYGQTSALMKDAL